MTRRSKDSSRRTGCCNSWTIISSVVRPQSATVNLPQQDAQPITGAHDPHFQGRDTDAGDLGHLVVSQFFHVLQEKRFSLVGAQFTERAVDLLPPHRLLRRMLLRRIEQGGLIVYECLSPSHAPCPTRPTPIDEDAEQPRTESLGVLAARQRSVRAGERILQRLLRIFPIAQHVHGIPRVLVPVSRDERAVRVHLSVQHPSYEHCIRALHTVWTLHRHLSSQSRTRIPIGTLRVLLERGHCHTYVSRSSGLPRAG